MRQIKFRCFNKATGKIIDLYQTTPLAVDPNLNYDGLFIPFNEGYEIMQFTGLLDKNKKEVYEGDICKGPNGKQWIIQWLGHSWCMTNEIIPNGRMKFAGEETYTIDKWLMLPPTKKSIEVIGNIYENPELLSL